MRQKITSNTVAAVIIPLGVALLVRTVMLCQWIGSPLRYYYGVKGLDMQTNLRFGEMFYNGLNGILFTPHRLIVALTMFFNSGISNPDAVVIIQVMLGIPTGAMIGWIALRLTGKRSWAMLSGVAAALYSPLLIHECFLGKDALTADFAVLSLFTLFWAHKQHFRARSVALASCCVIFPLFNHLSALPFAIIGIFFLAQGLKWNIRAIAIWVITPALGLLIIASSFHLARNERFIPFDAPFGYIARVSLKGNTKNPLNFKAETEVATATEAEVKAETKAELEAQIGAEAKIGTEAKVSAEIKVRTEVKVDATPKDGTKATATTTKVKEKVKKERIPKIALGYFKKAFMLFKPYEIPNNINHYFIKNRLGIFNSLLGPLLLIPLAVTSILLILYNSIWRQRFTLPLLYIAGYALPLIAFYPLARYRIILCPVFCLLAPYLFFLAQRLYRQKKRVFWAPPLIAAVYAFVLFPGFDDELLRATDFVAFGKAQELKYGNKKAAEQSYREAVAYTPSHLPGVINLADSLIINGKAPEAMPVLDTYHRLYPEHPGISYYYALSLMGCGDFSDAAAIFALSPPPDNPLMQTLHNFYHGECLRLTGNPAKAMEKYREALKTAEPKIAKNIKATMKSTAQGLY